MMNDEQKQITVHAGQVLHDTDGRPYVATEADAQKKYPAFFSPVKRLLWIKLGKKWYQV